MHSFAKENPRLRITFNHLAANVGIKLLSAPGTIQVGKSPTSELLHWRAMPAITKRSA
jgi:hypothetical protein